METLGSDELGGDARSGWLRRWWPDLVGLAWVIGAAAAVMIPALVHGTSLGPIGSLSKTGLSLLPRSSDNRVISDQLTLFVPWTNLAWTQVHNGQLPMWNPYSVLGMPLAFNWESAPFGLPALVGYLVPVNFAYTVGVRPLWSWPEPGCTCWPGSSVSPSWVVSWPPRSTNSAAGSWPRWGGRSVRSCPGPAGCSP